MQHTPLILIRPFPPRNLLLGSLTINRRLIFRITLHNLTVRSENDVDALQNIKRMIRIKSSAGAVTHDPETTVGVLLDFLGPLCEECGAGD